MGVVDLDVAADVTAEGGLPQTDGGGAGADEGVDEGLLIGWRRERAAVGKARNLGELSCLYEVSRGALTF